MEKPEYNIGDKVWSLESNKCVESTITGVQTACPSIFGVHAEAFGIRTSKYEYSVSNPYDIPGITMSRMELNHIYKSGAEYFPTKEKLIQHIQES